MRSSPQDDNGDVIDAELRGFARYMNHSDDDHDDREV
jgi:hypothetical protein